MTLQKLSLLAALTLAISVESIQAAHDQHAAWKVPFRSPCPSRPLPPSVPTWGVVVIPATGQTLKQPDAAIFPTMVMLQKFGNFFERPPQITTRPLPR